MWIFWLNLFTLYSLNSSLNTHIYPHVQYLPYSLECVDQQLLLGVKRVGKSFETCVSYTLFYLKFFLHLSRGKKCVDLLCVCWWCCRAPMGRTMVNKLWCKFSCLLNFIFLTRVFNCCCFMFRYELDLQLSFCTSIFNSVSLRKPQWFLWTRVLKL